MLILQLYIILPQRSLTNKVEGEKKGISDKTLASGMFDGQFGHQ